MLFIDLRERERETSTGCLFIHTQSRDGTCNLGMFPDQELNLRPFGLWDTALTNWATLARANFIFQLQLTFSSILY